MGSFQLAISVLALAITLTAADKEKHKHDSVCQEFSRGVSFTDAQALGSWRLLDYRAQGGRPGGAEGPCLQFTAVTPEERESLSDRIGQYVENLSWGNLTLKMQVPCEAQAGNTSVRSYYLERLGGDGAYRTLQVPPPSAKLDLAEFHRYPMRFKPVEAQYLALMDCHEKVVFLLGRDQPGGELEDRLKKAISAYWPEEATD